MKIKPPRSLFTRVMLLLTSGLTLSLMVSVWLLLQDRDSAIYHMAGLGAVTRIAQVARMLDSMPVNERDSIVELLSHPPLRLQLLTHFPHEWIHPTDIAKKEGLFFVHRLQQQLAKHNTIHLIEFRRHPVIGLNERQHPLFNRPMHEMMHGDNPRAFHGPPGGEFTLLIALKDGQWLAVSHVISSELEDLPTDLLLFILFLFVAVITLSLIAVRWLIKPLQQLAQAATNLGVNIHQPPITIHGPVEVQNTVMAFNLMQSRLQQLIDQRSRTLAALSHDLKTPLTRLRLRNALMQNEPQQQKMDMDLDEMEKMIQGTLDYMTEMATNELYQTFNLTALVETVIEEYEDMGHSITLSTMPNVLLKGQMLAIKRAVTNVVGNAIRYGDRVVVNLVKIDSFVTIEVIDRGPGIAEEELQKVTEPFYRCEASRNRESGGSGLGLAIVKQIVDEHRGTLEISNRKNEKGLRVVIALPSL